MRLLMDELCASQLGAVSHRPVTVDPLESTGRIDRTCVMLPYRGPRGGTQPCQRVSRNDADLERSTMNRATKSPALSVVITLACCSQEVAPA